LRPETRQSAGLDPAGSQVLQEGLQEDGMPAVFNMKVREAMSAQADNRRVQPSATLGVRRLWGSGEARTMGLRLQ